MACSDRGARSSSIYGPVETEMNVVVAYDSEADKLAFLNIMASDAFRPILGDLVTISHAQYGYDASTNPDVFSARCLIKKITERFRSAQK